MPRTTGKELGRLGEDLAAEFLVKKGYRLLRRNWVICRREIDLLMLDGDTLVVVEVKTLAKGGLYDPADKLDLAKRRKLSGLAKVLEAEYPENNIRIDAVTLYWKQNEAVPVIKHFIDLNS